MTDQDKAKAIERASSYRQMMETWAWKDLNVIISDEKRSKLDTLMTSKGTDNLEFTRGFVAALNFIDSEISFITEPVK